MFHLFKEMVFSIDRIEIWPVFLIESLIIIPSFPVGQSKREEVLKNTQVLSCFVFGLSDLADCIFGLLNQIHSTKSTFFLFTSSSFLVLVLLLLPRQHSEKQQQLTPIRKEQKRARIIVSNIFFRGPRDNGNIFPGNWTPSSWPRKKMRNIENEAVKMKYSWGNTNY